MSSPDREFWLAFYRALMAICKAIKKRYLGGNDMTAKTHVNFTESETVLNRIEVPLPNGRCLRFDLPDGVGRDAFSETYKQVVDELYTKYRRPPPQPDWESFANEVQSRLDGLGGRVTDEND